MAFNFSSNLERHMYENGIDLLGFTVEQAVNIANFISINYHNRRLRCGFVLQNDCLTHFFCFCAYWYLYKLLELLAHNTPFSVVDESLAFEILQLIGNLKWFFEGAWWSDLEAFLLDHEKYSRIFVEQLEYSEKLLTEISEDIRIRVQQVLAQERGILVEWNSSVEGSEQVFRESLEHLAMHKQELKNELTNTDAELMEVRSNLKEALKARAKLASLEFNIVSPSIIREKDTI
ncbi:hypothetical protein MTR_1g096670 [Medicago truncatula]|uniref:Uncharacterized protein n=1 Tax=Medicago truncatula TaxID=3880 RepID=A0A072VPI5_MEDTR|nr:hypothetical protein MTR_1g096670 [Medicago truncatula]